MRNPFGDVVKLVKKTERIILQHVDNNYYICDGHYIFKLNEYIYNGFFRTECTCFQEIENGASAVAQNYKTLPEYSDYNLKKIYDNISTDPAATPVEISRFLYEIPEAKNALCRIGGNERFTVVINENFVQAAKNIFEYVGASTFLGTGSKKPVFFNMDDAGAVLLPINNNIVTDKNFVECFHVVTC